MARRRICPGRAQILLCATAALLSSERVVAIGHSVVVHCECNDDSTLLSWTCTRLIMAPRSTNHLWDLDQIKDEVDMQIEYLADMYTKGQSPVFSNPAEFGLSYEDVEFCAEDGVTLRGWLIKGGEDKVIVHSHFGCVSSRCGYTPEGKGDMKPWNEPIDFLRQARYLVDAGYSVLLFDFRNHGDSDGGSNPWITIGPEEHKDVLAAVGYLRTRADLADASIGLVSICMGSAATMFAFDRPEGLATIEQVKCLISVQPVDFDVSLRNNGADESVNRRINELITERVGFDLTKKTFLPALEKINVPTLVMQNENDPMTEIDHVEDIYARLNVEKKLVMLDLEAKRFAGYDYIGTHSDELLSFLGKYMGDG